MNKLFESLMLGAIAGLIITLCFFGFDGCAPAQHDSICNDTEYVRLCHTLINDMTQQEYDYYVRANEDCRAQLRARSFKVEGGK
ncbi:MAG: hypothetical protein KGJ13_02245 [Patescibacteria group bacterium]|nr:hypothetical protein [Patescibacteria group bacterium]